MLPKARTFELRLAGSDQVIRGRLGPAITDPGALNAMLHRPARVKVSVTRVGTGRPRYVLVELPVYLDEATAPDA